MKEIEKTVGKENLIYRASEYTYSFKSFQTINTFGNDIYNGEITSKEADDNQVNLLVEIINFKKKTKAQDPEKKQERKDILKILYALFEGRERVLDAFESKIFPIKTKDTGFLNFDHSKFKILTSKQMLQGLPIALAQVKAGNNSESLLYEIKQIVFVSIKRNY